MVCGSSAGATATGVYRPPTPHVQTRIRQASNRCSCFIAPGCFVHLLHFPADCLSHRPRLEHGSVVMSRPVPTRLVRSTAMWAGAELQLAGGRQQQLEEAMLERKVAHSNPEVRLAALSHLQPVATGLIRSRPLRTRLRRTRRPRARPKRMRMRHSRLTR